MSAAGALDAHVEAKLNARVPHPSSGFARAIALAAIRETFEETGLAIGVGDYGAPQRAPPGAWSRFAATGVYPALDDIDFLARAITPPGRPKRFDARFLVVDASAVARRVEGVVHPEAELVDLVLDAARQGARTRPAQHHAFRARGSRRGAERRSRQAQAASLLSRATRQAHSRGALGRAVRGDNGSNRRDGHRNKMSAPGRRNLKPVSTGTHRHVGALNVQTGITSEMLLGNLAISSGDRLKWGQRRRRVGEPVGKRDNGRQVWGSARSGRPATLTKLRWGNANRPGLQTWRHEGRRGSASSMSTGPMPKTATTTGSLASLCTPS